MSKQPYVEMICNRIELKIHNHPFQDTYPGPITAVHETKQSDGYEPLAFSFNGNVITTHVSELENLFYTLMGEDAGPEFDSAGYSIEDR